MDYHHNGFVYKQTDALKNSIGHDKKLPDNLFKYYSLSKKSVDAIINGELYASHPFDLNDVFDCSHNLWYANKPIKFENYEWFYDKVLDKEEVIKVFEQDSRQGHRKFIVEFWTLLSDKFGIISMSGQESDLLMWPHYSGEYGFQVKFSARKLEKDITEGRNAVLTPVNYVDKLEMIDVSERDSFIVPFIYSTNIKYKNWSYENEWRFLVEGKGMGIPYSKVGFETILEDHKGNDGARLIKYEVDLQEEITLGKHFFNPRRFVYNKMEDENGVKTIQVKVRECDESANLIGLLDHISFHEKLRGNVFLTGHYLVFEDVITPYIERGKEKVSLTKIGEGEYSLIYGLR
ncbi:DUF2971 domain-containing protein [Owenweeksia hongkongensis]|uniref:DUF2971 domain-containing protein n=1 Tax=Owenweeksia hongkongensis TaxID=253245 RepID=UPI003A92B77B